MAGTDPFILSDKAAVVAAWDELTEEGWEGGVIKQRRTPGGEVSYRLDMSKDGNKETAIDAWIGEVLKPMPGRQRFLKFSNEDYIALFGGGS